MRYLAILTMFIMIAGLVAAADSDIPPAHPAATPATSASKTTVAPTVTSDMITWATKQARAKQDEIKKLNDDRNQKIQATKTELETSNSALDKAKKALAALPTHTEAKKKKEFEDAVKSAEADQKEKQNAYDAIGKSNIPGLTTAQQDQKKFENWAKSTDPNAAYELQLNYLQSTVTDKVAELTKLQTKLNKATGDDKVTIQQQYNAKQKEIDNMREEMYKVEPKAEAARATREAADATSKLSDLVTRADALKTTLEKDTSLTAEKKAEIEKQIKQLESEAAVQKKLADDKKNQADYLNGKRTFAQTLTEIVEGYNEFSGLGVFSSLLIDDKDLQKRKNDANDLFCSTWILGGTQCWTSKLCEYSVDANMGGVALVARTPAQEPKASAHIEADISLPITYRNLTTGATDYLYLYRITYYLNNPTDSNMTFNMRFTGPSGTYYAFQPDKRLEPGSSSSQLRTNAIVRYSTKLYTEVCLTFDPKIKRFGGGEASELCNQIVQYSGGPTNAGSAATTSTTTSGGTSSSNDFGGF